MRTAFPCPNCHAHCTAAARCCDACGSPFRLADKPVVVRQPAFHARVVLSAELILPPSER